MAKHSVPQVPVLRERYPSIAKSTATTRESTHTWVTALEYWRCVIEDATQEAESLRRVFGSIFKIDPKTLLCDLDSLAEAQIVSLDQCSPVFIRTALTSVSDSIKPLLRFIERRIGDISSRDIASVASWRQILVFLLRYSNPLVDIPSAVSDWRSRLSTVYTHRVDWVGDVLMSYCDEGSEDFILQHLAGQHGPGSSFLRGDHPRSARISVNQKDAYLQNGDMMRMLGFYSGCTHLLTGELPRSIDSVPACLATEVPKSWKKNRLICIEEPQSMYCQQAVKNGLYEWFAHDSFLRQHIDLHNVDKVVPLLREGSISSRYATIDLSNASDSVSVSHVKGLFRHMPRLLGLLLSFRSSEVYTRDDKGVHMLTQDSPIFATMGNAFCFPVETLVFVVLCLESIRINGGAVENSRFRVYGDDIIIEREYSDTLLKLLATYGFTVNVQKSFYGSGHFRESCGWEYYRGYDITPFRLPRSFNTSTDRSAISMLVSMANDRTCPARLRSYIMREVLTNRRCAVPLSKDGSVGFKADIPNNCHLVRRFMPDYWAVGYAYPGDVSKTETRIRADLALYEWLGAASRSPHHEVIETSRFATAHVEHVISVYWEV